MALSASAKDYLSRFFPGPPSPLWETDPEFMELFANFALDEVVNQGDLDDAARMMAILAALLGCQVWRNPTCCCPPPCGPASLLSR